MATSKPEQSKAPEAPVLGEKGDVCVECGNPLDVDQRYCLNCGARRTGPRVDFRQHLFNPRPSENGAAAASPAGARVAWSPLAAVMVLALLGAMLLVGVLIGKDDNDEGSSTTTTPAAQTTPTAPPTAVAPAVTTPAVPPIATTPQPATPTPSGSSRQGAGAGSKVAPVTPVTPPKESKDTGATKGK